MIINYNTRMMEKYSLSFETIRNGTIYKDHENIRTLRKSYFVLHEMGDHDSRIFLYKGARFSDINALLVLLVHSQKTITEAFEQTLTKYDLISIDEYGYPDLLDYEGSGSEAISWWTLDLKVKRQATIKVFCHFSHSFNAEGQIT